MIKTDWIVKLYTNTGLTISEIGMINGTCTWSTSDMNIGILSDGFADTITHEVDVSVSGNYAKYEDVTLNIVRSAMVEKILIANGTTAVGKRIEIIETDGSISELRFAGIVRSVRPSGGDEIIVCDHLVNFYNASLVTSVGAEPQQLVYGENAGAVKLIVEEAEEFDAGGLGNDYIPMFVVDGNTFQSISVRSYYDIGMVSTSDLQTYLEKSVYWKINSSESLIASYDPVEDPVTTTTSGGKTYARATLSVVPMNVLAKGDATSWAIPVNDVVTLEATAYTKVYLPFGIEYDIANLKYENNGRYYPFPSYIDSRKDYSDRIEIADSDNVGYSVKYPYSQGVSVSFNFNGTGYTGFYPISAGGTTIPTLIGVDAYCIISESSFTDNVTSLSIVISGTPAGTEIGIVAKFTTNIRYKYYESISEIYDTKYLFYTSNINETFLQAGTSSTTIDGTDTINVASFSGTPPSAVVFDCMLPDTAENDEANKKYRYSNDGLINYDLGVGTTYNVVDGLEQYVINSGVSVETTLEIQGTTGAGVTYLCNFQQKLAQAVEYDSGAIYIDPVSGLKDDLGATITDTNAAYKSAVSLQDFHTSNLPTPPAGWGKEYPSSGLNLVVDQTFDIRERDISFVSDSVETNDVKYDMLRLAGAIGFIDTAGKETAQNIPAWDTLEVDTFSKADINVDPIVEQIDTRRVYPEIGVTWGGGSINITNVEQIAYDPSYVNGYTGSYAERLWKAGNLLYRRYGQKPQYPQKLGKCEAFKTEQDAVDYIRTQYALAGAIVDTGTIVRLYDRYTVSFRTSIDRIWGKGYKLGREIFFTYPNIATPGWQGYITGIEYGVRSGEVVITAEMLGDIYMTTEEINYIETGTAETDIVESGFQYFNVIEG